MVESLQHKYALKDFCFACGPKNRRGLRLKSVPLGEAVVANWKPKPHHVLFGKVGSGGIVSVPTDCHGNPVAAHAIMSARNLPSHPGTVASEYTVGFLHPSPTDRSQQFSARATKVDGDGVNVSGALKVDRKVNAKMTGLFVALKESHPAFHRWH